MSKKIKSIVAIVGRANTGKSTLFNRLAGKRIAIVADTPGVTRDRIYADCEWNRKKFTLIDTAGIEPTMNGKLLSEMRRQADIAISVADIIIFLCDIKTGVTANDEEIARILRRSKKTIILVCNKADNNENKKNQIFEFYNLGLGDPIAISATHGNGTGDLLDEIVKNISENTVTIEEENIKIAVTGKPNAGKSSIINKILGEDRMIVSPIAGTTRDSVDSIVQKNGKKFILIDTAGIRKRNRIDNDIEKFSVIRSFTSIDRADVVLHLIDGIEGVSEQDSKIIGYSHDNFKPIVVAVNKWDIVKKDNKTQNVFKEKISKEFPFLNYAPIIFISAKTGQKIEQIFERSKYVYEQNSKRVSTGTLNEVIHEAIMRTQPPAFKGKRLKIYYATQNEIKPPTFMLFVNDVNLLHFSYQRYLENQIRENFDFNGTAIKFLIKSKK